VLFFDIVKNFWFALTGLVIGAFSAWALVYYGILKPEAIGAFFKEGILNLLALPAIPLLIAALIFLAVILVISGYIVCAAFIIRLKKENKQLERTVYELHAQLAELLRIKEPKR